MDSSTLDGGKSEARERRGGDRRRGGRGREGMEVEEGGGETLYWVGSKQGKVIMLGVPI